RNQGPSLCIFPGFNAATWFPTWMDAIPPMLHESYPVASTRPRGFPRGWRRGGRRYGAHGRRASTRPRGFQRGWLGATAQRIRQLLRFNAATWFPTWMDVLTEVGRWQTNCFNAATWFPTWMDSARPRGYVTSSGFNAATWF